MSQSSLYKIGDFIVEEKFKSIEFDYRSTLKTSSGLYNRAERVFPNGVTHDNRFHRPFPVYVEKANKGRKWDVDGREYVDFWMGHGALILGHCHPTLVSAVSQQIHKGTHYGASNELEIEWGEWVKKLIPSAERVRFTGSGTEATLMALRLARNFTGKQKVIKFAGHFHGWHDNLIVGVNPPFDQPVPAGVLKEVADSVLLCSPNQLEPLEDYLNSDNDIACVIIEPTGGSFGVVPTPSNFLKELRDLTHRNNVLLIFDEVVTGFRCSPGGAQAHFNVIPDLTSLAKILSGGLPGGCLAGRKDILGLIEFHGEREWDHCRKMPHPGTFNANPLSAAAGIATLNAISSGEEIKKANQNAKILREGLNKVIASHRARWIVYGDFSGFKILPNFEGKENPLESIKEGRYDFLELKNPAPELKQVFRSAMLLEGVDLGGWSGLVASVHSQQDLDWTVDAFDKVLTRLNQENLLQKL